MSNDIRDADFEPAEPEKAKQALQRYEAGKPARLEHMTGSTARDLDPTPKGVLERMSPARAVRRATKSTLEATELTRRRTDLVKADSELKDALVMNEYTRTIAHEKAEGIIAAERSMKEQIKQEARRTKLQADLQEEELQRRRQQRADDEARRKRQQDKVKQSDDLEAQIEREEQLLRLAELQQRRAALNQRGGQSDESRTKRRDRTPSPELRALVERAETVKTIREHCDDQRVMLQRSYERGVIGEEQLEDGLEEIDRNEAWAIAAYEGRQEGGG